MDFKQKCQDHYTFLRTYFRKYYNLHLRAFTGVFRDHEGNYLPWGELYSEDEVLRDRYNKMLDFASTSTFQFASVLFAKKNKKQLPFIVFTAGEIPALNDKTIIELPNDLDIITAIEEPDFIIFNRANQDPDFDYPFMYAEIEKLEKVKLKLFNDPNTLILTTKINSIFKQYRNDFSLNEADILSFFSLTSLLSDEIKHLVYVPFQPLKTYVNGCIFLNLAGDPLHVNNIEEISWVTFGPLQEDYFKEFQIE